MNKLLIAIAVAAITTSAHAELTSKQFAQLKSWADSRGYFYEGITKTSGTDCFVFNDRSRENNIYGLVPVSSDTADEAINALIASSLICREFTARQIKDSQYAQAVVASVQSEPEPTPSQKPATGGIDHTGMPINVLNRIKAKAQKDWPDDYSMQKYQIEEESEAYLDLQN